MKLRCERDVLVDALVTTGRAAGPGPGAAQVLSGIHLALSGDSLRLASTDRDLTIRVETQVAGGQDGACIVPARLMGDIVRSLDPGAVVLEALDDQVRVSAGRSQFAVHTYPEEQFPRLSLPTGPGVVLEAAELADALRQVLRAASTDDTRPTLTGVLLAAEGSGLRLVATDSYRLALRDLAGTAVLSEGQQVLVPARGLSELQRLLTANTSLVSGPASRSGPGTGERQVTFWLGEMDVTFQVGAVVLATRLLQTDFPNYRNLLPSSYPNRLVVGKEPLLDALRRVKLMVKDAISPVRMDLGADGVQLRAATQDVGQASEDVDAKYEGTELTIAFNPAYFIAGVEGVVGDEVMIEVRDAGKPATIRANEADSYKYLISPMRVS